jgi:hypothetical protein
MIPSWRLLRRVKACEKKDLFKLRVSGKEDKKKGTEK